MLSKIKFGAAVIGSLVVIGCNLVVIVGSAAFLRVPRGEGIRPMGWALLLVLMEFFAVGIGIPCVAFWDGLRRKRWSALLCILAITPWPLGFVLLNVVAGIKGFSLEP